MNQRALPAVVIVIAVAAVGGLVYIYRPVEQQGDRITDPERAEAARAFISEQAEENAAPDYATAFERAQNAQSEGRLADAQLLYFYAARGGHAPSEFALAEMNDPNHHSAETSLLSEPDAFQAYKWYSAAQQHGSPEAAARLEVLHTWVKEAAAGGDAEAERLLLQWQ